MQRTIFIWFWIDFYWEMLFYKSKCFDSVLTRKYWKINRFDSVLNLEILENHSFWFSFECGHTRKNSHFDNLWSMMGGRENRRAGRRPGRWLKHLRKNPCLEHVVGKTLMYSISLKAYSLIFKKKDARRKMIKFGAGFAPKSLVWDGFRPDN